MDPSILSDLLPPPSSPYVTRSEYQMDSSILTSFLSQDSSILSSLLPRPIINSLLFPKQNHIAEENSPITPPTADKTSIPISDPTISDPTISNPNQNRDFSKLLPTELSELIVGYYMGVPMGTVNINIFSERKLIKDNDALVPQLNQKLLALQLVSKSMYNATRFYRRRVIHHPEIGALDPLRTVLSAGYKQLIKQGGQNFWMSLVHNSKALRNNVAFLKITLHQKNSPSVMLDKDTPEEDGKDLIYILITFAKGFRKVQELKIEFLVYEDEECGYFKMIERNLGVFQEKLKGIMPHVDTEFGRKNGWRVPKLCVAFKTVPKPIPAPIKEERISTRTGPKGWDHCRQKPEDIPDRLKSPGRKSIRREARLKYSMRELCILRKWKFKLAKKSVGQELDRIWTFLSFSQAIYESCNSSYVDASGTYYENNSFGGDSQREQSYGFSEEHFEGGFEHSSSDQQIQNPDIDILEGSQEGWDVSPSTAGQELDQWMGCPAIHSEGGFEHSSLGQQIQNPDIDILEGSQEGRDVSSSTAGQEFGQEGWDPEFDQWIDT